MYICQTTEAFSDEQHKILAVTSNKPRAGGPHPVPEVPYEFADPCPTSMKDVNISDLRYSFKDIDE